MEIITALEQLHRVKGPCVIALGTFDGLHLGHQDVILAAREQARATSAKLAVFTFSNHPLSLIRPEAVPVSLISPEKKLELLEELGVDILIDIPFNKELAQLTPDEFLAKLQSIDYSCLTVGENFTYGIYGRGTCTTMAESAKAMGFKLIVRPLVSYNGTVISSTAIRQLISNGLMDEAARMLGRSYCLSGIVAHGNERGRLLGYPTANIELEDYNVAAPKGGVYMVQVILDSNTYYGMANIGKNPTFGDVERLRLEVNIFDFNGDIYGKEMTVIFKEYVRGEVRFSSIDALKSQLAADKEQCMALMQKTDKL